MKYIFCLALLLMLTSCGHKVIINRERLNDRMMIYYYVNTAWYSLPYPDQFYDRSYKYNIGDTLKN